MSAALVMWLASCSLKAGLLLVPSWLGAALLRRGAPAARHQIWTLGVIGALVLPLLCWVLPSLSPLVAPIAGVGFVDASGILVTTGDVAASSAWTAWLAIAWLVGALLVAFRFSRGHLAARRLVNLAGQTVPAAWTTALREAAASIGLDRRIRLLRSVTIGSPMTIGVLAPCVLLPAAADDWSPERLRAVLVHELGHVRRHDTSIQIAAQLACALYWWNPLAWLAATRLRIEREHACDDLVLGAGILPSSYAADLLDVARSISMDAAARAGAICMADRSATEARLRRILDATAPRRAPRAWFRIAMLGMTLASAVTLACTSSPPPRDPSASLGTLSIGAPSVREPPGVPFVDSVVTFGPPATIDLPAVAAEVNRRLDKLERCYERRLAVDPELSGTVTIHWSIAETGKVNEACITSDTVNDPEVTDCVNGLVQEGPFPAARGGSVDVSVPFVFTARSRERSASIGR